MGLFAILTSIFIFSTKPGLFALAEITEGVSFFASWQITLFLFLFFISLLGLIFYCSIKKLIFEFEALAIGFLIGLFTIIALLPPQNVFLEEENYYLAPPLSELGIFWAILFNILIFVLLVGIIFLGYKKKESWLINLGSVLLFLLIIFKYFDWFFGFLHKSLFFIGAGILLLLVGWLMEKKRRDIISKVKEEIKQV